MLFDQRELDVYGSQECEDIGLKYRYEEFEDCEDDAKGQSANAEEAKQAASSEQEELRCRETQHEEHVARDHVHQKSQRQRNRAKNEGREELDRCHRDVKQGRYTRGEQRRLEEVHALLFNSRVNEDGVGNKSEHEGNADYRGTGNVEPWHNSCDVHRQDHEEHGRQQRHEPLSLFLAERTVSNVGLNETNRHLEKALAAAGDHSHAASAQPEQQDQDSDGYEPDHHDAVDFKRSSFKQETCGEELNQRGAVKAPVA